MCKLEQFTKNLSKVVIRKEQISAVDDTVANPALATTLEWGSQQDPQ
jgi:hypothetical protein